MQTREWQHDGRTYHLVQACTWRARSRGLAQTVRSDWTHADGMQFNFPCAARWPIWMRDMQFAITVLWLRRGHIVDQRTLRPAAFPHQLTFPKDSADTVIELFAELPT